MWFHGHQILNNLKKNLFRLINPEKLQDTKAPKLCVSLCTENKRGGEDIKDISFKTTSKPVKCL